jgi:hypothetical protein
LYCYALHHVQIVWGYYCIRFDYAILAGSAECWVVRVMGNYCPAIHTLGRGDSRTSNITSLGNRRGAEISRMECKSYTHMPKSDTDPKQRTARN